MSIVLCELQLEALFMRSQEARAAATQTRTRATETLKRSAAGRRGLRVGSERLWRRPRDGRRATGGVA